MNKHNRIFFKGNPYSKGHLITNFIWSGRLDQEKGLVFDFHLDTDNYYAEDDSDDIEEPKSDWCAKIAWRNFHKCTLSSTEWHYSGITVGTPHRKFDFKQLNELLVDKLPLEEGFDFEDLAFHIYLLGHDSCANHRIIFKEIRSNKTYNINWTGKIALTYCGEVDFIYDFEANISNVNFAGVELCENISIEENKKLLKLCVTDDTMFELIDDKFQLTNQ